MRHLSKSLIFGLGALGCAAFLAPVAQRAISNAPANVVAQSYARGKCFIIKDPLVAGQFMHSKVLACPVSLDGPKSYAVVDAVTLAPKIGESLIAVDPENTLVFAPFTPSRPKAAGAGMLASLAN